MPDLDLSALDPGIRETVQRLRSAGFDTTDSGDGSSKLSGPEPMECALSVPHVVIRCEPSRLIAEARRLRDLLVNCRIPVGQLAPDGSGVSIQASYDPADETAIIMLCGVSDAAWGGSP